MNVPETLKAMGEFLIVLQNNRFAALVLISLAVVGSITAIVWRRSARR